MDVRVPCSKWAYPLRVDKGYSNLKSGTPTSMPCCLFSTNREMAEFFGLTLCCYVYDYDYNV